MAKNDCTIRALSAVSDLDYAEVVGVLEPDGYVAGKGFWLDRWLACRMNPAIGDPEPVNGYRAEWIALPAVKGQKRHTLESFARAFPVGRFILKQARHVCAVIDGVPQMEARRSGACVYGAWKFTRGTNGV